MSDGWHGDRCTREIFGDTLFRPQSAASIVLSRDAGKCPRDITNVNYAYKVDVN